MYDDNHASPVHLHGNGRLQGDVGLVNGTQAPRTRGLDVEMRRRGEKKFPGVLKMLLLFCLYLLHRNNRLFFLWLLLFSFDSIKSSTKPEFMCIHLQDTSIWAN